MNARNPAAIRADFFHHTSLRIVAPKERGGGRVASAEFIGNSETHRVHNGCEFPDQVNRRFTVRHARGEMQLPKRYGNAANYPRSSPGMKDSLNESHNLSSSFVREDPLPLRDEKLTSDLPARANDSYAAAEVTFPLEHDASRLSARSLFASFV